MNKIKLSATQKAVLERMAAGEAIRWRWYDGYCLEGGGEGIDPADFNALDGNDLIHEEWLNLCTITQTGRDALAEEAK